MALSEEEIEERVAQRVREMAASAECARCGSFLHSEADCDATELTGAHTSRRVSVGPMWNHGEILDELIDGEVRC